MVVFFFVGVVLCGVLVEIGVVLFVGDFVV